MNPFLNPTTGLPFIKNLILDPGRLKRLSTKKMERYRNKALRKTIKYAYKVPFYHKKYDESGIHYNEIRNIEDIKKLPFISKNDIIKHFPDEIIPRHFDRNKVEVVCTSGSTGKPIFFYTDFSIMTKAATISLREFQNYNLHWKKSKIAYVINYTPNTINEVAEKIFFSKAKSFFSLKNHIQINPFDNFQNIIKKLNDFKPDTIISYPVIFQHLAFFKKKGYGEHINPRILIVGGHVLDDYTRNFVEDVFNCKMVNVYGSAESGGDIAFECVERTWHINHDFYHVEAINKNKDLIFSGKKGHIVVTRLFGKGTPFIRYTGMDDWVTIIPEYKCNCGLKTPIFKNGVEGRLNTSIVLPDGRIFSSGIFANISAVLNKLKTSKIKQFQIIQNKIDEIDILFVIDDKNRNVGPSIELIFNTIKKAYEEIVGPAVKITVKEVKDIKSNIDKPSQLVISKIKPEEIYKILNF